MITVRASNEVNLPRIQLGKIILTANNKQIGAPRIRAGRVPQTSSSRGYASHPDGSQTERATRTIRSTHQKGTIAHEGETYHQRPHPLSARESYPNSTQDTEGKRLKLQRQPQQPTKRARGSAIPADQSMLAWGGKTSVQTVPVPPDSMGPTSGRGARQRPGVYIGTTSTGATSGGTGHESQPALSSVKTFMTPAEAIREHPLQLTRFEKTEIRSYPKVSFLGLTARQKLDHLRSSSGGCLEASSKSGGLDVSTDAMEGSSVSENFDDEQGNYNIKVGDHIAYRYEVVEHLGKGSFGQVVRCIDHEKGEQVALKLIRNKRRFYIQGCVEVKILTQCAKQTLALAARQKTEDDITDSSCSRVDQQSRSSRVISILDSFVWRGHLAICFPVLSMNLYEVIKRQKFQGLSANSIRGIVRQLVTSLSFLKQQNVIHCDLKPENILLCEKGRSDIRLIDLGSACFANQRTYTYIQSRFYRAPEVILGIAYTCAIDMWSLGCVIVELVTGTPIFPGANEKECIALIMEVCGVVPKAVVAQAPRRQVFFNEDYTPKLEGTSKGRILPAARSLVSVLGNSNAMLLSFVQACLNVDPEKRLTPEQALKHPWLSNRKVASSVESRWRTQQQVSTSAVAALQRKAPRESSARYAKPNTNRTLRRFRKS